MLLLLLPLAFAYGEKVHAELTREALSAAVGDTPVTAAELGQVDALIARIDSHARVSAALSTEWTARYPTPESFDRWELKELLLLSPDADVYGFDRLDPETDLLALLSVSSRRPDDDFRNRDRLNHNPDRSPQEGVPDDPVILNMGKLGALSSQAHAHYGLDQLEFSEDPAVLQTDPPRFAVAAAWPEGPVLTFAPEMAQAHLDLSTLAALEGFDGLSAAYAGQAFHYVEDVGNPIHTVQVGLYDFFKDAFFERLGISAKTAGGYFGELPTLASIGIGILSNHHTISEQLAEKKLIARDPRLEGAIGGDDAPLAASMPASAEGDYGLVAARTLVHAGTADGAPMYASTRAIADPRYRKWGVEFDWKNEDPEDALRSGVGAPEMETFWALQETSFHRAATTVRAVWRIHRAGIEAALATPEETEAAESALLERFLGRQLTLRRDADARRARYLANPPVPGAPPPKQPAMLAGEIGAVGLLAGLAAFLGRRASKRRAAEG